MLTTRLLLLLPALAALIAGCGFRDRTSSDPEPTDGGATLNDGSSGAIDGQIEQPTTDAGQADGRSADAGQCAGPQLDTPVRLSSDTPVGVVESDAAIALTTGGTLYFAWVERPSLGALGSLWVARDDGSLTTLELGDCTVAGPPDLVAFGEEAALAVACENAGSHIFSYRYDDALATWLGPELVDDTGDGPERSAPRLATNELFLYAVWTEDGALRTSSALLGSSWEASTEVSVSGGEVSSGAVAADGSLWIAYASQVGEDSFVTVRSTFDEETYSTMLAPVLGAAPDLATDSAGLMLVYRKAGAAEVRRSLDGDSFEPPVSAGMATGDPRIVWADDSVHVLLPDGGDLAWAFAADDSKAPLGFATGEILTGTLVGAPALAAEGETLHVAYGGGSGPDTELLYAPTVCTP